MAIGVALNESSVAIEQEVTEGTYISETAGASFIQVLSDGLEMNPAKDLIDRDILTNDVEQVSPRVGQKSMSASIPVELKASQTAGDAPETNDLYEGLLGGLRQNTTQVTCKAAGNTSTNLEIEDADIAKFAVGDMVKVLEAGAFEIRPITVVDSTGGSAAITLAFALDNGAPSASVVIEEFTTYFPDSSSAPTLSVTRYIGGEIREKAIGMRVTSGSLNNFTTGSVADMGFSLEGLDFDREDGTELFTPTFDTSEPPVVLESCVWINGVKVDVNNFSITMENEIGFITSTCSANGKIASRITKFKATGSFDPYMDDTDVSRFDSFKTNGDNSIFAMVSEPSGVTGEDKEFVAVWLPKVKFIEAPIGDQEGIATDAISFQAFRELGNDSVFLGFV